MDLEYTNTDFNPTHTDVVIVRRLLQGLRLPSSKGLPLELALGVLALANYYPRLQSRRTETIQYEANKFWNFGPIPIIAGLYLTSPPLPEPVKRLGETTVRAKRITFQMRSGDQGWTSLEGEGTYENSYTWFDASILTPSNASKAPGSLKHESFDSYDRVYRTPTEYEESLQELGWELVQHEGRDSWKVHSNITAQSKSSDYRVDWVAGVSTEIKDPRAMGDGQGFLEKLAPGCIVALWARAGVSQDSKE